MYFFFVTKAIVYIFSLALPLTLFLINICTNAQYMQTDQYQTMTSKMARFWPKTRYIMVWGTGDIFLSMSMGNSVVCRVWSLPDSQDGQCTQLFVSFTVYVKVASPFQITLTTQTSILISYGQTTEKRHHTSSKSQLNTSYSP